MKTFVALLRGINVWGKKKVEMSRLKSCFEEMGYTRVLTYINSGNVIFDSENDDFSKVELTLEQEFWFAIPVIFRDAHSIIFLAESIRADWCNDSEYKTDVIFLAPWYEGEESLHRIVYHPEVDHLVYIQWAIVWHLEKRLYSKSKIHDFIGTEIYKNMTARNINTVRKLAAIVKKQMEK